MSILNRIVAEKRLEVDEKKKSYPIESFVNIKDKKNNFFLSREDDEVQIIAEIKRASPSKGDISPELDASEKANEYMSGGAKAVSVLTDKSFFKGSLKDLEDAKSSINIPVLRKDFIIDEYQIYESSNHKADALLLIARILTRDEMNSFYEKSVSMGMVPLVEVFSMDDLEIIKDLKNAFVGINNRNLKTFETSLDNSLKMAEELDKSHYPVALSGILSVEDAAYLHKRGLSRFLIGEYLSKAADSGAIIREIIEECKKNGKS